MPKILLFLLIFHSLILATGCGGSQTTSSVQSLTEGLVRSEADTKSLALVKEDLATLRSLFPALSSLSENATRRRFVQVFGGTSGDHIRNFVDERIKYFLSAGDLSSSDNSSSNNSSSNGSNGEENQQERGWTYLENSEQIKNRIAASNYGAAVWFQSLVYGFPATVLLKTGKEISVNSPRVGIMLIGPAYNATLKRWDGSTIEYPQEYRQSLLIHEARHSDCVGGVTQDDLRVAREATSYAEFLDGFGSKKCGHLHELCKSGDYEGFPACDSVLWGSYGIQALYLEAALKEAQPGSEKFQLLLLAFNDTKTRLFFDYDLDMIHGTEDPELSSMGLR